MRGLPVAAIGGARGGAPATPRNTL